MQELLRSSSSALSKLPLVSKRLKRHTRFEGRGIVRSEPSHRSCSFRDNVQRFLYLSVCPKTNQPTLFSAPKMNRLDVSWFVSAPCNTSGTRLGLIIKQYGRVDTRISDYIKQGLSKARSPAKPITAKCVLARYLSVADPLVRGSACPTLASGWCQGETSLKPMYDIGG